MHSSTPYCVLLHCYFSLLFDAHAEAFDRLGEQGYAVIDNFISPQMVDALLERFQVLAARGDFFKAGIGKLQHHTVDHTIRGDYIHWLEDEGEDNPEIQFAHRIALLRQWIHRQYFLALRDQELHMAHYPPGTFYKRHTDLFVQHQHRVLSVVLYLNKDWQPAHGGALRLYVDENREETIAPLAGRLLVFRSALEHEVLPTTIDRYTITGWLLDQETGVTFL